MAMRFKRVTRTLKFKKDSPADYTWLSPDRGEPVSIDDVYQSISDISGINKGQVVSCTEALVKVMNLYIRQGHAVKIEGLGSFIPSFHAKGSKDPATVKADSIYQMKLVFLPCKELKQMMENIEIISHQNEPTQNPDDKPDSI